MKNALLLSLILFSACQSKQDTISPVLQSITESVYASGVIVSKNQYQVFATVSGIVDEVFVDEGVAVENGSPILSIVDDTQKLMTDNAKLAAEFNALHANRGKLDEARSLVDLTKSQMESDSSLLERQKSLWAQNIGAKVTLEQKELAYESSKSNYESATEKLAELARQLNYLSKQAQNNLLISNKKDALLIPRSYLLNDSIVVNKSGKRLTVRTGLKDYQMVEILAGIDANEALILPEQ